MSSAKCIHHVGVKSHLLHLAPASVAGAGARLRTWQCWDCRIKREEDRLKREIEERELKEAEELLAKSGKGKKLKEGEKLDKNAIMQVTPDVSPSCRSGTLHALSVCVQYVDRLPLDRCHHKSLSFCVRRALRLFF